MIEFVWKNRLWQWDYFTFTKKSEDDLTIARTSLTRPLGTFNAQTYVSNVWDRGTENLNVQAIYSGVANSDYLTETQAQWIEGLFTSEDVYIFKTSANVYDKATNLTISADAPQIIPVVIKSASYKRKTSVNDKCISYTIQYEYSKEQRV